LVKYIALLRGINVGGKNSISMKELKAAFEENGFANVATYINSGNVLFDCAQTDEVLLAARCEEVIEKKFGIPVRVAVFAAEKLREAIAHAPSWWGDAPDEKHNAIFVIPPVSAAEIVAEVGDIKPEYEKLDVYESVIFWSASIKHFSRTRWSRIVGTNAYRHVTIRNANTARKLSELVSVR